ncbi:MAG: thermonuclease family protein [Gammaproteobacteria bacterium]
MRATIVPALAGLLLMANGASLAVNAHYAFVQEDGSLRLRGKVVRLFGVYVPPTAHTCRSFEQPLNCNSRAALALDFKIAAKGVRCENQRPNADGTITASCYSGGVDLSAYLLQRGWAVALPNAPFEYVALERIARSKGLGVWGVSVDNAGGIGSIRP